MVKFLASHEYVCPYWENSFFSKAFTADTPMPLRLQNSSGSDTVISIQNLENRRVNFALNFWDQTVSVRVPILFPTNRSLILGHVGHIPPIDEPAPWVNYSTRLMQGYLMSQNLIDADVEGSKEGQKYSWRSNGWWEVIADGELAITAFVERYSGLGGTVGHTVSSHAVMVTRNMKGRYIGKQLDLEPAYPEVAILPTETTEAIAGRPSENSSLLPRFTPSTIDDTENQIGISFQPNRTFPPGKVFLTLRNPPSVKLKKLVRFGPHDVVTAAPAFGTQITQDSKLIPIADIVGKKIELWQAGFAWFDFKKYEIEVDDVAKLEKGTLIIDWNRDGPKK